VNSRSTHSTNKKKGARGKTIGCTYERYGKTIWEKEGNKDKERIKEKK
jgi:hypothetical protein